MYTVYAGYEKFIFLLTYRPPTNHRLIITDIAMWAAVSLILTADRLRYRTTIPVIMTTCLITITLS